ncbi:glycine-rich domain-containing protein-like [Massilia sp. H6]|uniref:glycine-rich domain-containing protein n=1 Tax=Massilia sp. H6 TaxID=2970464 RepID=UPI002167E2E4|nr:glycine-rich domain-containing protein-like [Massilia sp. H6]UVW29785.1 glycine-rich domain-containing protein-like [Massilia sp. H6]
MSTNEFAAFEALDLAPIKMKLMHVESGEGWSALRADAAEVEYRRFLFLMKKFPDAQVSPTVDVDTFWHYHILDTMKYAVDCEAMFGYFLHHYPYVGIGADADAGDQARAGERMREIYEAQFGIAPATNAAHAWCSAPSKPRESANAANAWCTAPSKPRKADDIAYAWCSAPSKQAKAGDTAYAWCSAPSKQAEAGDTAYAWCSAPSKPRDALSAAYAWCSAPSTPQKTGSAAYAWCSAPSKPREAASAAYAWCSAPSKPREAVNAANAWCSAPSKSMLAAA